MDKWEEMYNKAKKEYHREEVSPFIIAHHVVSAVESEDGEIFTGFCIESASGVMNLCAERVAALNMYINTGKTKIKKKKHIVRINKSCYKCYSYIFYFINFK